MRFRSAVPVTPEQKWGLSRRLIACLLAVPLSQSLLCVATAQTVPEDKSGQPSTESQNTDAAAKDENKIEKYDVNRIGQRNIGHGFNLYSARRERELGEHLAAQFNHTTKIINDAVVNEYVNQLAQKVVRYSDADVPFTVKVIDSGDVPHAYGLPGGFLYVNSALILASDAEAELAGVMAHEIAHIAARHATRALTRERLSNFLNSVAYMAGPAGMAWQDIGTPLSLKKFARDAEYEADLLGIEYAWAAGYDPKALLEALEKLHAMEVKRSALYAKIPGYRLATKLPFHSKVIQSFASYPLTEDRISRLQSEMFTFLPDRKDYILDTDEFQEVKSRLLESRTPILHRSGSGDDDKQGPVLRRMPQSDSELRTLPALTFSAEPAQSQNGNY